MKQPESLFVDLRCDASQFTKGIRAARWSLWRHKWRVKWDVFRLALGFRLLSIWSAITGADA